jgi:hypothetical protein
MEVTSSTEKSDQQQVGPFGLDHSGDRTRRANAARTKTALAIEALLEGAAEAITRKLIEEALQGDRIALRLCFERLSPPRRDVPVAFELPLIESAADARRASASVLAACAQGRLSPSEAATVMGLITAHVGTLEVAEIEARVAALEKGQSQ